MKKCKKCGGFDRYRNGDCRPCAIAMSIAYQKRNKEKKQEYDAMRYLKNIDMVKKSSSVWQKNNPDKVKQKNAKWHSNNMDKARVHAINRKSRMSNNIPCWFGELDELVTDEAIDLRKKRDQITGIKWHVDHIVPVGGRIVCGLHIWNNIQVIPASVNLSKNNRYWPSMP